MAHHAGTRRALLGGGDTASYTARVLSAARANLVGYWPLSETSGTTAFDANGNYNGLYGGATVAAATFANGDKAPTFDGAGYVNVYSAGFAGAFNKAEGTAAFWLKMPTAAQWADATARYFCNFYASATEQVHVILSGGLVYGNFKDAGGTHTAYQESLISTAWVHFGFTWSATTGDFLGYVNGYPMAYQGAGVVGFSSALSASLNVWGALRNNGGSGMKGALAHAAIWSRAFTPSEVLGLVSPILSERGILFVGDSKSAGDTWLSFLPQLLNETGNYNYQSVTTATGIPGATVASAKATVISAIAAATRDAHVCTINYGASDVASLPVEATWKADMQAVVDAVRAKWAGCRVFIARPWRRDYGDECDTLAGWIDDIVATYASGVYVGIDERVWLEGGDDGATMTVDGIHYSVAGQTAGAAAWFAVIT